MFMRLFGRDGEEQIRGIATFVIAISMTIILLVIVVAPIVGDKTSETKISTEIVKVMVGVITSAFSFLLGNMSRKSDKSSDD